MGWKRNACGLLVGKPAKNWLLRRPRCRWVVIIKLEFGKIGGGWGRPLEGSCEHANEPSGAIKCWEVLE
jgi:hypothetical protein